MDQIELACPYCAGRFAAGVAAESRTLACPHCGRQVTVPAVPREAASVPAPLSPPSPAAARAESPRSPFDFAEPEEVLVTRGGAEVPLRRLSPKERARFRRRLNVALAAIGMAILAVVLAILLRIRP